MKMLLVPALVGVLSVPALAQSPGAENTQISGTITQIDSGKHQLTLSDGQSYTLPADMKTSTLKVGDKVAIAAQKQDGANIVRRIAPGG